MAKKKIIDIDAETTFIFEKKGQEFAGYYIGSKAVNTEFGPSKLHVFQTEEGNVGVWGSSKLDEKLGQVTPGEMVTIKFEGKVKIAGGKTMKKFEVWLDDEDTIDVGTVAVNFQAKGADAEEEEEEEEQEEEQEEEEQEEEQEEEEEEETARNPVQSKPSGKAKPAAKSEVAALLSKSKRTKV